MDFDAPRFIEYTRKFSPVYIPFFNNRCRYSVVYGGAGSGKSHIVARKLLYRLITETQVKHKFLILRKVDRTIKRSVFELMKNLISKWKITPYFNINLTDKTIELKSTGSAFLFAGVQDLERIKSIEGITGLWLEEASEFLQEDLEQLDLRLRGELDTYKEMIVTFNPISAEHWLKKHFFDSGLENVFILKTTYKDNIFIDDEYKDVLLSKKLTNPRYYNIYCLGEWGVAEGLIFNNVTNRVIKENEIRGLECVQALDWGYSVDPTAFHQSFVDKANKKIYIYDGFYEKGMSNSSIANKIKSMKMHRHLTVCDSSEPKSIASLSAKGVRVKGAMKGKDSINAGIDFLSDYELIVNSHLVEFMKELLNYCWAVNRDGKYTGKPVDEWNHFIDSLRYSTEHLQARRGRIGKINKPKGV